MNGLGVPGAVGPAQESLDDVRFIQQKTDLKLDPFTYGFSTGVFNAENLTFASINLANRVFENFRDKDLSPEEAKAKYGIESEGPISNEYAKYKYERQQAKIGREFILSSLDENKFGSSLYPFLGELAGGIADPVGMLLGAGMGKAAYKVATAYGSNRLAQTFLTAYSSSEALKGAIKAGAIQGGLESIISTPVMMLDQQTTFDRDWTSEDAIFDVVSNIVGGSAFESLGYGIGKAWRKLSPGQKKDMTATALNKTMNGKRFEYDKVRNAYLTDIFTPRQGESFRTTRSNIAQGEFYAAFNSKDMSPDSVNVIDGNFGKGFTLTDRPDIASRAAVKSLTGEEGAIALYKINYDKLLDVDKPMPPEIKKEVKAILKKHLNKQELKDLENTNTYKEFLDKVDKYQITEQADVDYQKAVNDLFKSKGYEGYKYIGGMDELGEPSRHNGAFLFDSPTEKPIKSDKLALDENSGASTQTAKKVKEIVENETNINDVDPALKQTFNDLPPEPMDIDIDNDLDEIWIKSQEGVEFTTPPEVEAEIASLPEAAQPIARQLDVERKTELTRLSEVNSKSKEIFRAAEFCVRNNQ